MNTSTGGNSGGMLVLKILGIALLVLIGAGVALVVFASLWGLFISTN